MDNEHIHNFLNNRCEICGISSKECQHESINIRSTGYENFIMNKICVCGHKIPIECFHPHEYRRGGYDLNEDYYDRCNLCGYMFY